MCVLVILVERGKHFSEMPCIYRDSNIRFTFYAVFTYYRMKTIGPVKEMNCCL